jgi:hypothetical protein
MTVSKVIEVVRDARGEMSDGFHLLRLAELVLQRALLRHVLEDGQHMRARIKCERLQPK